MSALSILDVVIGVVVVYLLLSVVCSGINELIMTRLNQRGKNLARGILRMLGSTDLHDKFYAHPRIQSLRDDERLPSYVPSATFALVLLDLIAPAAPDWKRTAAQIGERIDRLPADGDLRRNLVLLMDRAGGDVERLEKEIESWFNDVMERASGWYKRHVQRALLVIGLVVVVVADADTIRLARDLARDPVMRQALVSYAQQATSKPPPSSAPNDSAALAQVVRQIDDAKDVGIPLGWSKASTSAGWFDVFIGLLISTFAVALGSPFWFDLLGKLLNVRAALRPPDPAKKAGGK